MSQTVQASASAGDEQQARTHGGQVQDVENGRKNSAEAKQDPATIKQKKRQAGLLAHLNKQVATTHADILLLACCLISGLADSTIYNAYGTFVSMQTGNTIFLGLGGATSFKAPPNPKPYGWAKSLISITCFCFGCFSFSHFSRIAGPLRRGALAASFLLQTVLILVAAALIQAGAIDGNLDTISSDIDWKSEIPIALLSFQSAGQIIGSRTLNLSEIPTVVLTSLMCDLVSDPKLMGSLRSNVRRNRRVLGFFGILIGAVAGGFISEGTGKVQVALWIAGGLKAVITLAWVFWPESESSFK